MTDALKTSKDRLQLCTHYLKPIFQAMKPEVHDGAMWSRMLSLVFADLKADLPLGLSALEDFECNLQHPLSKALKSGYDLSATREQDELQVRVLLHGAPEVTDHIPRTGYQVRVLAVGPGESTMAFKHISLGPVTKYDAPLEAVDLTIPLADAHSPIMLLLGIIPHNRKGPTKIMSDSGMKVVWVG